MFLTLRFDTFCPSWRAAIGKRGAVYPDEELLTRPVSEWLTIPSEVQASSPEILSGQPRSIMRRLRFPQKPALDEFVDAVFAGFNNSDASALTPDRVFGERPARL